MIKTFVLILIIASSIFVGVQNGSADTAINKSAPITITIRYSHIWMIDGAPTIIVEVTSTTDDITITDININRGNCANIPARLGGGSTSNPKTLKFGESALYEGNCNKALEVEIKTNQGVWTFP